ncbi:MAG: hypothetical protein ACREP9_22665, partial [Candidatus Dormibacteraceae bacterium]
DVARTHPPRRTTSLSPQASLKTRNQFKDAQLVSAHPSASPPFRTPAASAFYLEQSQQIDPPRADPGS